MTQGIGSADTLLLASQPIFDKQDKIHGVELLYRHESGLGALDVGEAVATAEVIYQLHTAIAKRASFSQAPVFVNVSAEILLSRHFLPLSPEHVVIELVERIVPTPELIEAVQRLHRQGFRFALDDFAFNSEWSPLLSLATYIKVDISTLTAEKVELHKHQLSHLDLRWIAERVETREERDAYQRIGFELFQGYFYARPTPLYGKKIPAATLQATKLLNALCQTEPDIGEIINLIQSDPELAIKLTRVANSAFYRQQAPISSLKDVVARLGFQKLSSWAAMFGLMSDARSEHAELALARAKACELLAQKDHLSGQYAYFIGLLSTADLLLGIPSEQFLGYLGLDSATVNAILHREGSYGNILERIEGTERYYAMRHLPSGREDAHILTLYRQAHHAAFELLTTLTPMK
ncbi:EAL and HDOD domain-containing protein [Halomonas sp. BC04]|uniref:EAL and HDOD domain-containing protein n=1 Tax=Halomonas sp. BC04 TaxID=1403540 RepID=UPI0003ED8795|nr:EAL domain-containing protein [Halomonas sp. BC04]EWH02463.1 hypothetical protein Q427_08660 [Halomonas sp. BC04]